MRVLVLSHMFPRHDDDWGGVFVHEGVLALRREGVDARVLAGDGDGLEWKLGRMSLRALARWHTDESALVWRELRGVPVVFFRYASPFPPHVEKAAAFCYAAEACRAAARLRAGFPFDLAHAHTSFLDGSAGVRVAKRFGVPWVLTEHTGPFSTLTRTPLMRWQTRRAIDRADAVLAVSAAEREAMRREARPRRPGRIEVLPNGVRVDVFHPKGEGPPADGTIRVLWVGGLVPVKRLDLLLDAFALARRERPDLRLTLVGDGPLEAEVRSRIVSLGLGDVAALGPSQTREGVAACMRRHHFGVVSSETESFSLVTAELLACGRPVLSTRCGGPESIVTSPALGQIVDGTTEALAKGMVSMAGRVGEFDEAGIAAHARSEYGFEVIARRTRTVYERVLGSGR